MSKSEVATDPGIEVVKAVYDLMKIDQEWSVREDRGFTWWGKDFAQRVWAEPATDDDGFKIYRVHARSDLWKNFNPTADNLKRLNAFSTHASLSGFVRHENDPGRIQLAASMYVHSETTQWVSQLFALAVAIQAVDAQIKGIQSAMLVGAEPDITVHPKQ